MSGILRGYPDYPNSPTLSPFPRIIHFVNHFPLCRSLSVIFHFVGHLPTLSEIPQLFWFSPPKAINFRSFPSHVTQKQSYSSHFPVISPKSDHLPVISRSFHSKAPVPSARLVRGGAVPAPLTDVSARTSSDRRNLFGGNLFWGQLVCGKLVWGKPVWG